MTNHLTSPGYHATYNKFKNFTAATIGLSNANSPAATITQLEVNGLVGNSLVTLGIDEVEVYTFSTN